MKKISLKLNNNDILKMNMLIIKIKIIQTLLTFNKNKVIFNKLINKVKINKKINNKLCKVHF